MTITLRRGEPREGGARNASPELEEGEERGGRRQYREGEGRRETRRAAAARKGQALFRGSSPSAPKRSEEKIITKRRAEREARS